MTTQTETKPKPSTGGMDQWPPLVHIERRSDGPLREGKLALCGAKLMGIPMPDAAKVCAKCERIYRQELGL